MTTSLKRYAIAALMTLSTAASAAPGPADDRLLQDSIPWITKRNVSPDELQALIDTGAVRVTDLRVEDTSPLRLSAVLVQNSGAYFVDGEFVFHGLSWDDSIAAFQEHGKRPIVMQGYVGDDDVTRWVGVTVPNTGANHRDWLPLRGDAASINGWLNQRENWHYRPMTIGTYLNPDDARRYVSIVVDNVEGYDWWLEFHVPHSLLDGTYISEHGSIIDASANDDDWMGINVLCYKAPGVGGWPWWDPTRDELIGNAKADGRRALFITHYTLHGTGTSDGDTTWFAAVASN
jgi:hypothetical protein